MSISVDVLITGYPGISESNGGLSWSTVALVRGGGRVILVDTGPMGARSRLKQRLGDFGLGFGDVTDLVLTHLHHDHSINWPLFPAARIHVSRRELEWARSLEPGVEPTPEFYSDALAARPGTVLLEERDTVMPGVTTEVVPGHTPGSMIVRVDTGDGEVIFTGDAAKNRAELLSRRFAASADPESSRRSIELIHSLWRGGPRTIVIPGHDLPLRWRGDRCETIGERPNSLQAWLGEDFDDVTHIPLDGSAVRRDG